MDTNSYNDDGTCDLWEACRDCEGTGEYWTHTHMLITCQVCHGTGKYIFGEDTNGNKDYEEGILWNLSALHS